MKTLVIVDFQKDFCCSSGSLYVKGSEESEQAIIDFINKNTKDINEVIFTVDWHSPNHCSFVKNGGTWPMHCVQFTEGAGISDNIMKACIDNNITVKVFKKGNCDDTEEYGAFNYMWEYDQNHYHYLKTVNEANQHIYIESSDIIVCGIAGDFCVKETLNNLLRHNVNERLNLNIEVFTDGIASIDDGTILNNFIKENNLTVI